MRSIFPFLGYFFAWSSVLASIYVLAFAIAGRCLRGKRLAVASGPTRLRFLVLIPAHNEANGIQATIESALHLNYPSDLFKVVTIADNCDDSTGQIAASCGSQVWSREDLQRRGKGHALSWAFQRARNELFDIAVVIDADTEMHPDFLKKISIAAETVGAALDKTVFQGRYDFAPTCINPGWFETFTIASKAAENSFVYRPRSAAGLVNLLQGNGFCVPRKVLETVPFASTSIVEDADYSMVLALAGVQVHFVNEARVLARMTTTVRDAAPQRVRWAGGIFHLMPRFVAGLIAAGIAQRRWQLFEAILNLLLSSRLVLVYMTLSATVLALFQLPDPAALHIFWPVLATVVMQVCYLWMIFRKAAEKPFSMRGLLFMPAYIGMVGLSQAAALVGIRGKRWTRTVR